MIFQVNDLKKDIGYVNRISTFMKNLHHLKEGYHEDFKREIIETGKEQLIKFESIGRYVVLIESKKNWDVISMIFFDLKKDKMKAKEIVDSIVKREEDIKLAEQISEDFLFAFLKCNLTYDQDYDLVKLELDTSEMN